MSLLTVLCVSGTRACHILVMEFWILGVGSNWYRYNRGIILGKCWESCSPADDAMVEKPNAAPCTHNATIILVHHYNSLRSSFINNLSCCHMTPTLALLTTSPFKIEFPQSLKTVTNLNYASTYIVYYKSPLQP